MKIERDKEKPGTWKVDGTIAGKRIREDDFASRQAVEEFITELKERARRQRHGLTQNVLSVLLADLGKEYLKTIGSSRNDLRAKKIVQLFLSSFPPEKTVQELRAADLSVFINTLKRLSPDLKPDSINRYLACVKSMMREGPALFAPLEDWRPPKFPWQRVSKRGRERVISREEQRTLLNALRFPAPQKFKNRRQRASTIAARREAADALEIGINTAMRPGEVIGLRWTQIDFDAREVHLPETKTGEPGDIPLNRRVIEILKRRYEARATPWVFPNQAGDGPRDVISKIIRPVAKDLQLEYGRELANGFTTHSQRHTATTQMMRAGHDLATVKSVTRHSDTTMTLRYAHASHGSRRAAVEDLVDAESGEKRLESKPSSSKSGQEFRRQSKKANRFKG